MTRYPAPLPTVIVEPVVASPDEILKHAWALDLPIGATVACYRIGPLDDLDRRLATIVWEVFGCEVDITVDPPPYPFLWIRWHGIAQVQLQVWRWRIYPAQPPAFAEIRWSPGQESYAHLCHLSLNSSQRQRQQRYLGTCISVTQKIYREGRPVGTGTWRTKEEFLQEVEPLVRQCWQDPHHLRPTERRIEAMLNRGVTAHTLGYQCRYWLGVDWDTFVEGVRLS
jgi:hypothetical protein